jgi:hypothetical protein
MATTVIDLLSKPELIQAAKDEWQRQIQGRIYESPLPPGLKPPLDQLKPQY